MENSQEKILVKSKTRVPNFEILRTVAMLFIVIWHFCVHGLENAQFNTSVDVNLFLVQLIMSVTSISVNCYVMITGYFMIYSTNFKIKRVEKVWLNATFYSVVIAVILFISNSSLVHLKNILNPFYVGSGYWFVDKYLGLILLSPFLAKFATYLSKNQYIFLLFILFILNFQIPVFQYNLAVGEVDKGHSLQWFIFLFFVAGYIKKYNPLRNTQRNNGLFVILLLILLVIIITSSFRSHIDKGTIATYYYNGFCFFFSTSFFMLFKNHKFQSSIWKPFIKMAPYTFGVYLIHDNEYIRQLLWHGDFSPSQYISSWVLIPLMFVECIAIFCICAFIDFLRSKLVDIIHGGELLDKFNSYVSSKCMPTINKLLQRHSTDE